MLGLSMAEVRAMTHRDIRALNDVLIEEQQEGQRQAEVAAIMASQGRS